MSSFCLTSLVMVSIFVNTFWLISLGIKKPYDVLPSLLINDKITLVSSGIFDNIKNRLICGEDVVVNWAFKVLLKGKFVFIVNNPVEEEYEISLIINSARVPSFK